MEFKSLTTDVERNQFISAWECAFARTFVKCDYDWIFNRRNHIYAIYEEDVLVAGYCLLTHHFFYHAQQVTGALCNNVFVVKEYQGLNLFVKLGRYVLNKAAEQNIQLIIGMPNEQSVPGHRRVGWTLFEKNYFFEKKVIDQANVATDINANIHQITKINFNRYHDAFNVFSNSISEGRSFSVLKDAIYFEWRYLKRLSTDYNIYFYFKEERLYGYVVYKFYQPLGRLHVLDIEAENKTIFNELLSIPSLFSQSYRLINVLGSSIYSEFFLESGFTKSEEYSNLIAYNTVSSERVLLGEQVNIVLGDNEVF